MTDGTQIAMSYEAVEDRILVRYPVNGQEVRLWLTRRMAIRWLGAMAKIFDHIQGTGAAPVDQRRAVSQFRRESAVAQADFTKPYDPGGGETPDAATGEGEAPADRASESASGLPAWPADAPLLVGRMTVNAKKNGVLDLILSEGGDNTRKVTLSVSERELHGLTHMLTLTAARARWDLKDPTLPDPKAPKAPQRAH